MSARDEYEAFLTPEGRRKVDEFMAGTANEPDDFDVDAAIDQCNAKSVAAMAGAPAPEVTPDMLKLLTAERVRAYLTATGWVVDSVGSRAALWIRRGYRVRMSNSSTGWDLDNSVFNIATAEDRHPADVLDDILKDAPPPKPEPTGIATSDLRYRLAKVLINTLAADCAGHFEMPFSPHAKGPGGHTYDGTCALCRGDVEALLDAILPVVDDEIRHATIQDCCGTLRYGPHAMACVKYAGPIEHWKTREPGNEVLCSCGWPWPADGECKNAAETWRGPFPREADDD